MWVQVARGRALTGSCILPLWYPHTPLALAVGISGLTQLPLTSGSLRHLIAWPGSGKSIVPVTARLHMPAIPGVPQDTIGGLLLVIGIALFSLPKARDP